MYGFCVISDSQGRSLSFSSRAEIDSFERFVVNTPNYVAWLVIELIRSEGFRGIGARL